MIIGYAAFAHNITKRKAETLNQIGLIEFYKSIFCTLSANANIVEKKMRENILTCQFFILYNNMNFYEHVHNTCIFY